MVMCNKSHFAVALGVEAAEAGSSVFFATLAEPVDYAQGRARREAAPLRC